MRKRYQTGGIKKQRGRWIGMWWVDGGRKSRVLGLVKDMSKSKAREAVNRIVAEENAKRQANRCWHFGEFVDEAYVPYYSRKWKKSTRENNLNRTKIHLVASFGNRELSGIQRDELQDLLDEKAKRGLSFSLLIISDGTFARFLKWLLVKATFSEIRHCCCLRHGKPHDASGES